MDTPRVTGLTVCEAAGVAGFCGECALGRLARFST